jgi:hypothetical protein
MALADDPDRDRRKRGGGRGVGAHRRGPRRPSLQRGSGSSRRRSHRHPRGKWGPSLDDSTSRPRTLLRRQRQAPQRKSIRYHDGGAYQALAPCPAPDSRRGFRLSDSSPSIKLRPDGIVEIIFPPDPALDVASLRELFVQRQAIAPGKRPILLRVGTDWPTIAEGAAYGVADEVVRETSAVALLGGWALLQSMTELHVMKHHVPYPMRHFLVEDEAIAWLKTYV